MTAANVQNGPLAIIAGCLAHMDLIAADIRAMRYGGRRHLGQGLFGGERRFDIKMAETFGGTLWSLYTVGVINPAPSI